MEDWFKKDMDGIKAHPISEGGNYAYDYALSHATKKDLARMYLHYKELNNREEYYERSFNNLKEVQHREHIEQAKLEAKLEEAEKIIKMFNSDHKYLVDLREKDL